MSTWRTYINYNAALAAAGNQDITIQVSHGGIVRYLWYYNSSGAGQFNIFKDSVGNATRIAGSRIAASGETTLTPNLWLSPGSIVFRVGNSAAGNAVVMGVITIEEP